MKQKKKNIYRSIKNIDLFKNKLDVNFEYDLILSCGVFLEGHVSFSMIDILIEYLKKDGILGFSVRETFQNENKDDFNKYVRENNKINIIQEVYMDYLPNIKCRLILLKKK